jgi:drug/metabolite transporter (DMT)-like permease
VISLATLGALCALGSAMTWAVTSLIVRSLIPRFGSVAVNAARSLLAGGLLVVWVVATGGLPAMLATPGHVLLMLVVSIVFAIGIGDTAFFESTRSLGLGRAMTIATSYPVAAAILAALFLAEPITAPIATGTLLTLGGLALVVGARMEPVAGEPRPGVGVAAAAIAALAWAISIVLVKAPLREVDAVTAQAIRLPIAGLLLWATPWSRGAVAAFRASDRASLSRLAVLSVITAVSAAMFMVSVKYAGVTVAAVLSSTAPLFAVPLGILFLGERLSPTAAVGAAVTVIGIVVLEL